MYANRGGANNDNIYMTFNMTTVDFAVVMEGYEHVGSARRGKISSVEPTKRTGKKRATGFV